MTDYTTRPLVYLAGPYAKPDPVENTHNTIRVANRLVDEGLITPVIPHLSLLWHMVTPREVEFWYDYDLALLARCDGLLRLPGESSGADMEVVFAQSAWIPVFFDEESMNVWAPTMKRWQFKEG